MPGQRSSSSRALDRSPVNKSGQREAPRRPGAARETIRPADVARLFAEIYPPAQRPNEIDCVSLVTVIGVIRSRSNPARDFQNADPGFSKRVATVGAMERLIAEQKKKVLLSIEDVIEYVSGAAPREAIEAVLEDMNRAAAQEFAAFEAALARAKPSLLSPFDRLQGVRSGGWWHKAARMIAAEAREALHRAGHKNIAMHKQGKFVALVALALEEALGVRIEPEAVGKVLAKTAP